MRKVHVEKNDFGDSSLIDNKPRTARIITATPCHFALIHKNDFN